MSGLAAVLAAATEGRCVHCLRLAATDEDWAATEGGARPDLCWEPSPEQCPWVFETTAADLQAAAVLAWIEERLASDEVREAVARVTCCMVCEGTGLSLQGWTDKGGIPEGQYGPCRDCTAALTAVTAALRGQA